MTIARTPHVRVQLDGEPPFLTFLKTFVSRVDEKFEELGLEGKIDWEVKRLDERQTCIQMQYTDSSGPGKVYNVFVGKRYYNRDMLRIVEVGTESERVMEADPFVFLAFLTF